jgi:DNA polymerase-3 subunit delta'
MKRCEQIAGRWPEIWNGLTRARRGDRLAHAFLIRSDLPETREEFALALAALAACPHAGSTGVPCGECSSCRHLENGTYPELYHLSPVGRAYQIQVGDRHNPEPNTVRFFGEQFYLTSTSGAACKVGIIHDADRMNVEAQNALLKTLEEPPPETLMILTTGNPESLLPTTRSRCQMLSLLENETRFDFPGKDELFAALHALFFASDGSLQSGEAAAKAIIAIAAALREKAESKIEAEWTERLAQAAAIDPALAKRLEKQCESAVAGAYMRSRGDFLSAIHTWVSQLYLLAAGVAADHLPNPEILAAADLPAIDPDRAEQALREADNLLYNLRFNVNEETALRNFAIQIALLRPTAR